jgi:hypothetical protein
LQGAALTPDDARKHPGRLRAKLPRPFSGEVRLVEGRAGKAIALSGRRWVAAGNDDCFACPQIGRGHPFGPVHTSVPAWLTNSDHDLLVGEYDGSCRWPWVGKIDDLRIDNRTLGAEEVLALYEDWR